MITRYLKRCILSTGRLYDIKWSRAASVNNNRSFKYHDIKRSHLIIERIPENELKYFNAMNEDITFGRKFTDHMLVAEWKNEAAISTVDSLGFRSNDILGWCPPVIKKYSSIVLAPSALVFHYGIEVFEGMKAYKDPEGRIRLFRPMMNMDRLLDSSKRLSLPEFDKNELIECIKELVKIEERWIPQKRGYSLYIRPTIIGTQDVLGVSPSNKALFFTICCPVGPYFRSGFSAVSLIAEENFIRAWPGGTGCHKMGGNYAPGILPLLRANAAGYQQVLWLFGSDSTITEVGTMNLFVYWINEKGDTELATPALDGTILPGVTRDSILTLAKSWREFAVVERKITMHDIALAVSENRLKEMFGAGTAVIVCPIKLIHWNNQDFYIPLDPKNPERQAGPLTHRLAEELMNIQYGITEFQNWSHIVA